jgi:hypothetical protein
MSFDQNGNFFHVFPGDDHYSERYFEILGNFNKLKNEDNCKVIDELGNSELRSSNKESLTMNELMMVISNNINKLK